jgi:hypothetical protein
MARKADKEYLEWANNLQSLLRMLSDKGARKFYAKYLKENDNSKNQPYLGSGFEALNIFPFGTPYADNEKGRTNFKAKLNFAWVSGDGEESIAPHAQLILYPKYPEVRFSGFLRGCSMAPSSFLKNRMRGRVLFFAITDEGKVLGHVIGDSNPIKKELREFLGEKASEGILIEIPYQEERLVENTEVSLLQELSRIHRKGWIKSKRLSGERRIMPCEAPNCGGYTLEAELGITPNGYSDPDFLGWEVKQHSVTQFNKFKSGVITLMTPEPTGGYYKEKGVEDFVVKYGYPDKNGKPDRLNFGGIHKFGERQASTGLTLTLIGYDNETKKIEEASGGIALVSSKGQIAALWDFSGLIAHWNRKHAQAVYVPSMKEDEPELKYSYGNIVRLCTGTNFLRLLKAISSGNVYYDPGIKMENVSTKPKTKRRSQFRIHSLDIPALYESTREKNLLE